MHCFYQFLLMSSILHNFISSTPLLRIFYSWSKQKRIRTVRQYSGSLAHPRGMYYNGKEGRKGTGLDILASTEEMYLSDYHCGVNVICTLAAVDRLSFALL